MTTPITAAEETNTMSEEFEDGGFTHQMFQSTLPWRNLKTEVLRIKCCPSTLPWGNLKTEVLRIKCFPSTLRWGNLKTEVLRIKCFHPHYPGGI